MAANFPALQQILLNLLLVCLKIEILSIEKVPEFMKQFSGQHDISEKEIAPYFYDAPLLPFCTPVKLLGICN